MSGGIDETDLHAFIDGELPPARQAEVAAAIARDPALTALVAAYRADKAALAAAFAPMETVPVPPDLLAAALAGLACPLKSGPP
jgi:anti-sigma factor RsiW